MALITLEDLRLDCGRVVPRIVEFIRAHVEAARARGVVVGLSGGVDSTTAAYLAVKSLGSERVRALIMPDSRVTPPRDVEDARNVARKLGVKTYEVDIGRILDSYRDSMAFFDPSHLVAQGNLRARIRMCVLYYLANLEGLLVLGTGDKSELLIGYFTKYGDGGVDILPLGDLYKTQVRQLALHLGVPREIALKPSTPALWAGQTAEGELGMRYEEIDLVLYALFDRRLRPEEVPEATSVPKEKVETILRWVEESEHKRKMPPICKMAT